MPIDASIAMGYQPIKLDNPMNSLAQLMQLEQSKNQNKLAELQFQQHQQTQDDTNNLNALYAGAIGPDGKIDRTKLLQGAASKNLGSKIPGLQKGFLETDEAQGKVDKQKVDLVDAKLKQSRQFLDGVTTPEQYIAWHEGNHSDPVLGPMLASRGVTADQARKQITDALQTPGGFESLLKKSALGLEKFTELNKPTIQNVNNGKTSTMYALPGLGGAPVAINTTQMTTTPGDDLRSQDAAKGRAQSQNHFDKTQAAASQAVTYQTGANGELIALPTKIAAGSSVTPVSVLGADGKPVQGKNAMPVEFNKSVTGLKELTNALGSYEQTLKDNGGASPIAYGARRGNLQGSYTALQMGLKNAFELGALAGPDLSLLQGMLVDPTSVRGIALGDKGIAAQIDKVKDYIKNRGAAVYEAHKQPIPEEYARKPAATSANPQDAQAMEWAKSNPNDPRYKAIMQRLGGK